MKKETRGTKRTVDYEPIINMRKNNPYVPIKVIIDKLNLPIKYDAVYRILKEAKRNGEL
ncbi:hypothetical protein [Vibrio parahaemolyticus]|uniref:hypothetical protein n=1 Tax=Vibrio parahaemolyticus TaxID=670 RepID=UPI0016433304|nr:hypothetical protein [Vibrio parahaemolyticus]HCE4545003.1 hypothetical protein [Vibrio parahaemolyticus]HCH2589886.1 hypothetical protein [Vibrio parahaemolyticus]